MDGSQRTGMFAAEGAGRSGSAVREVWERRRCGACLLSVPRANYSRLKAERTLLRCLAPPVICCGPAIVRGGICV
jgi:hypothetical protein